MTTRNASILVRTKPTDRFAADMISFDSHLRNIQIHVNKRAERTYVNHQQEDWSFSFDQVLHNIGQEKLYRDYIEKDVEDAFDGLNATIIAFGQCGAGKSYTILGPQESFENRGVAPRAISQIFEKIKSLKDIKCEVRASFLEIYNDNIRDLLSPNSSSEPLQITETTEGGISIKDLTIKRVMSEEEAFNLMFDGEARRATAAHPLNPESSRSHGILTIYLECRHLMLSPQRTTTAVLSFVDLAGSEKAPKDKLNPILVEEVKYINKSIAFLEQVVVAASEKKRDHVPFRQSKLTHILRSSLGGNSHTTLLACIIPERPSMEETIQTLRFAQRVSKIATVQEPNIKQDDATRLKMYEAEIRRLEQELAMRDVLDNKAGVTYAPYTSAQRGQLRSQVKRYIAAEVTELPVINLRHVQETYTQFRIIIKELENQIDSLRSAIPAVREELRETAHEELASDMQNTTSSSQANKDNKQKKQKLPPIGKEKEEPKDKEMAPVMSEIPEHAVVEKEPNVGALPQEEAFELFKAQDGKELNDTLCANKTTLKEKRQLIAKKSNLLNDLKQKIDHLGTELEEKKDFFPLHESGRDEPILDEDVFEIVRDLKAHKKRYREEHEQIKSLSVDVDALEGLIVQCREKLLGDFLIWYSKAGGDVSSLALSSSQRGSPQKVLTLSDSSGGTPANAYYSALLRSRRHTLSLKRLSVLPSLKLSN